MSLVRSALWRDLRACLPPQSHLVTCQEKDSYLAMDRLSTIAWFLLGGMAFSEACGVAVQSILTVGGIEDT